MYHSHGDKVERELKITKDEIDEIRAFLRDGTKRLDLGTTWQRSYRGEHYLMVVFHPPTKRLAIGWSAWHVHLYDLKEFPEGAVYQHGALCLDEDGKIVAAPVCEGGYSRDSPALSVDSAALITSAVRAAMVFEVSA